jgi:hypothetical protein
MLSFPSRAPAAWRWWTYRHVAVPVELIVVSNVTRQRSNSAAAIGWRESRLEVHRLVGEVGGSWAAYRNEIRPREGLTWPVTTVRSAAGAIG